MNLQINNASVHIGSGAGNLLHQALSTARKEIKIVSPYLDAEFIQELIEFYKNKNLTIMLITTLSGEPMGNADQYDCRNELIKQLKHPNKKGFQRKEKLNSLLVFLYIALFTFAGACLYTYLFYHLYAQVTLLLLFIGNLIVIGALRAEIYNIPTYLYSYQTLFPLRVFIAPNHQQIKEKSKFLMHANIFCIDDETAFIGSANFTLSGLKSNYESLVEIKDAKAVLEISSEIEKLYQSSSEDLRHVDMATWGRTIYPEPIH